MKCRKAQKQLDRYMDGTLSETRRTRLEEHLRGCPSCRRELDGYRSLRDELTALTGTVQPERDLWPGILYQIRSGAPEGQSAGRIRRQAFAAGILTMAAGILIGIALGPSGRALLNRTESPIILESGYLEKVLVLESEYQRLKPLLLEASRHSGIPPEILNQIETDLDELDKIARQMLLSLEQYPGNSEQYIPVFEHYKRKFEVLKELRNASMDNPGEIRWESEQI